ncbi:hypothetical protein SB749_14895 [Brevibacterium sp. SIMBA_078]|uniref:hypothetical protein n=1 Tax=Brevibacterium sp. SIMBA_078 TaxID=3085816 RepID=UPI00397AFB59
MAESSFVAVNEGGQLVQEGITSMHDEGSETMRRWDSLSDSQRHPKNLAILAVESLALRDEHQCRVTILQDADYWNPVVSIVVESSEGNQRKIEIHGDDDPCSLATRVRAAAQELFAEGE